MVTRARGRSRAARGPRTGDCLPTMGMARGIDFPLLLLFVPILNPAMRFQTDILQ